MNLLKSLKERKSTTFFFILSFTMGILIFSLGTSAIISSSNRSNFFNPDTDKGISFLNYNGVTYNDIEEILFKENIGTIIRMPDYERSIGIETRILPKDKSLNLDMKSGSPFTPDEMKSNGTDGIYSSRFGDEIEIQSFEDGTKVKINKVASYYEINRIIIISNDLFLKLYKNIDITQLSIILQGDSYSIEKAVSSIEEKLKDKKNKDSENGITFFSPNTNEDNLEAKALYNAAILVFIITIINSISISSLWVESRKKEIVLRKVFGANDKDICKIFFGELLIISLVSLVLALLIQEVLVLGTSGFISNIDIRINPQTFIYSFAIAIITSLAVSIPSLKYISKIQPAEMLQEE